MKTVVHGARFWPLQRADNPGVLHIYALRTAIILRRNHCSAAGWLRTSEQIQLQSRCSGSASGGVAPHSTAHIWLYGG